MTETSAKILADSISPAGHRFTTFEVVYPRIILAEVNTHRLLTRSSASSRAIPVEKMIRRVLEEPYVPTHWGKNQKGMQAEQDVDAETAAQAAAVWLRIRDGVVAGVQELLQLGIHKQITNRWLEPAQWHPTLVTGTEFDNLWHLRDHAAAHPDFRDAVHGMREEYQKSEPALVRVGEWHCPLIQPDEWDEFGMEATVDVGHEAAWERICKVSVGRCARISYLTHGGQRDQQEDVSLHDRMMQAGHMAPYEHVARPMTPDELNLFKQKKMRWDPEHQRWYWVGAKYRHDVGDRGAAYEECNPWAAGAERYADGEYTHFLGNVQGWVQLRKQIPYEEDILGARP